MDVDIDMKAYGTKVTSKDFGLIWMKKVRNYSLFETKIDPYTHIYAIAILYIYIYILKVL